jgi:hypothetical protein
MGTSISVAPPNRASSSARSLAFAAVRSASLAVMIALYVASTSITSLTAIRREN